MPAHFLDLPIAAVVVWVAWRALSDPDLFASVVLFIAFGLLMALVWVRLGAEDVALAEAAIGAGLTGALLLDAVRGLPTSGEAAVTGFRPAGDAAPRWLAPGSALAVAALGAFLAATVAGLEGEAEGLTDAVLEGLESTGVEQPVTAVLLAFRGYDTLLETAVLLLAAMGMLAVRRAGDLSGAGPADAPAGPVTEWLVRLLLPVVALTGAHLLLLGTHAPGGAFQAGAILGAGAVLLLMAGYPSIAALRGARFRAALLLGFAVFLACALAPMLAGGRLLELPAGASAPVLLLIEAGVAASTAVTLAALFAGARPGGAAGAP